MIAIVHICDWCRVETRDEPIPFTKKDKLFETNPLNIVGTPDGAVEICKKCTEELQDAVIAVHAKRHIANLKPR